MSDPKEHPKEVEVPIEWYIPESLVWHYATNMIVQHTDHEFVLSFFEMKPPVIIGVPTQEALENLKSIRATCVAQIIVAKDRMPAFLEAIRTNFEKFESKKSPEPVSEA